MTNRAARWKRRPWNRRADSGASASLPETLHAGQLGFYVVFTRFVLIGPLLSVALLCGGCGLETPAPDRVPNAVEIRAAKAKADQAAFIERVRPEVKTFLRIVTPCPVRPARPAKSGSTR